MNQEIDGFKSQLIRANQQIESMAIARKYEAAQFVNMFPLVESHVISFL